jgi:RNA polymerase sigma-B factor
MSNRMPRLLTPPSEMSDPEMAQVFRRYARDRAPEDRETLVLRHLPLARHLARRYPAAVEREDVEQVASLGLLKAIERFDPDRGIAFTTFAVPTILGEIKRYFRDLGWSVRVPRALQELAVRVNAASEALATELGRSPTMEEIAQRCKISVEDALEALATRSAHRPESLDRPAAADAAGEVIDLLVSEERGYERVEHALDLDRMIGELPVREQQVIRMRFEEDLVQRDIGERLELSQMHVSRLLRGALQRLEDSAG